MSAAAAWAVVLACMTAHEVLSRFKGEKTPDGVGAIGAFSFLMVCAFSIKELLS